jgi:hypothetical protein
MRVAGRAPEKQWAQPLLLRGAGNCATSPHRTRGFVSGGAEGAQPLEGWDG